MRAVYLGLDYLLQSYLVLKRDCSKLLATLDEISKYYCDVSFHVSMLDCLSSGLLIEKDSMTLILVMNNHLEHCNNDNVNELGLGDDMSSMIVMLLTIGVVLIPYEMHRVLHSVLLAFH